MSYRATIADIQKNYITHPRTVVPNGQCVAFVEKVACTGNTSHWTRGARVAGNVALASGTAIATFDASGRYGNHTDGRSHAAIYISQTKNGIAVYDQWLSQPVHQRTIQLRDLQVKTNIPSRAVNDGNQYYVIE
jgi:hypothetical protein